MAKNKKKKNTIYRPSIDIGDKVSQMSKKEFNSFYEKELYRLQIELVKLQKWIKEKELKVEDEEE